MDDFLSNVNMFSISKITIDGEVANVFMDIYEGTELSFKNKIVLAKFPEGWEIVSRIFYSLK